MSGKVAISKIVFVTGRLAEKGLRAVLETMRPDFAYEVAVMPISVAALMTTPWIAARLAVPEDASLVMLPGLFEGDLDVLQAGAGHDTRSK